MIITLIFIKKSILMVQVIPSEGGGIIQSLVQFFSVLPEKHCHSCGKVIEEQADCYTSVCPDCEDTPYYPISNEAAIHVTEV